MSKDKGNLVRALWAASLVGLSTLLLSLVVMILSPPGLLPASGAHRIARLWAKIVLWSSGGRLRVEGLENLPAEGGYILAANHQSAFDIPVLLASLPVDFRWLAKQSLFKIPLMGWAMKRCGYIPVAREDSSKALGLLKKAANRIKDGVPVIVFPEGTRNNGPDRLLPFKKGGFLLARLAKRPIVPLAISGTREVLPRHSLRPRKGRIVVRVGRPIDSNLFTSREMDKMLDLTRQEMESLLNGVEEIS